jgi:hypothetical protein
MSQGTQVMRRLIVLALFMLITPVAAEAQPRLMLGGGLTTPHGDVSTSADPGYHVRASIEIGIPTLPLGFRGDGTLHNMGSSQAGFEDTEVLAGSLSLVFTLPGVGLQPYMLGGLGTYRVTAGASGDPVTQTSRGYHGGFGVSVGGLLFGAFAEVRYVHVPHEDGTVAMIPLTLGFRL